MFLGGGLYGHRKRVYEDSHSLYIHLSRQDGFQSYDRCFNCKNPKLSSQIWHLGPCVGVKSSRDEDGGKG